VKFGQTTTTEAVPIAIATLRKNVSVPKITSQNGVTRVKHSEVIANIPGNTLTALSVNPGLTATFPWLASIASSYEMF
jgi:hypothetical protein